MFNNFLDGDIFFQRNKFNIKDNNTYLTPIIYFGINFWNRILNKSITPINHVGVLINENGIWYVYEAKSKGIVKTRLEDKINNKDITKIVVKRYNGLGDKERFTIKSICYNSLNVIKYDYVSILLHFFRQLFNQKIDLNTNPNKFKNKRMNCSEFCSYVLNSVGVNFTNYKNIDPDDLYKDDRSIFVFELTK